MSVFPNYWNFNLTNILLFFMWTLILLGLNHSFLKTFIATSLFPEYWNFNLTKEYHSSKYRPLIYHHKSYTFQDNHAKK